MAVASLSMYIPSLGPITSSSPRSSSTGKHLLPTICSAQTDEPSRNEPSFVSSGAKNWRAAVSTAFAAAVVTFGCSLPANAGVIKSEAAISSAVRVAAAEPRSAVGNGESYLGEQHLLELSDLGSLHKNDHWVNLDTLSGSPEVIASFDASILPRSNNTMELPRVAVPLIGGLIFADMDPAMAKLAIGILGPSLSAFGFLFIVRIVMSWYPKLPIEEFPYILAYAPTEPFLIVTRKVIPPLGGVDVTPVVWFGIISFLNEILVGPQGLLILLSRQVG